MEVSTESETPEEAATFRELAAEPVWLRVDSLIVTTTSAALAVTHAAQTLPIVMTAAIDPVGAGFVASLTWPGGTVTGNTICSPELSTERLELLQDVVPVTPVAALWHAAYPVTASGRSNAPSAPQWRPPLTEVLTGHC
jgi:putative tryptophan/tyrosine transport system substrate-binding protein